MLRSWWVDDDIVNGKRKEMRRPDFVGTLQCPMPSRNRHPHGWTPRTHLRVAPKSKVCIHAQAHEVPEAARSGATHQLDEVRSELEGSRLEPEVAPGAVGQHEAEIDVDQAPLGIKQDVSIVPAGYSTGTGRGSV